jgi:hypothetical protein
MSPEELDHGLFEHRRFSVVEVLRARGCCRGAVAFFADSIFSPPLRPKMLKRPLEVR